MNKSISKNSYYGHYLIRIKKSQEALNKQGTFEPLSTSNEQIGISNFSKVSGDVKKTLELANRKIMHE